MALVVLLLMALPCAYAQDSTDSSTAAKPVLPASQRQPGKNVAKATPLPATDTPAPRVAAIHADTYIIGVDDVLVVNVWKEASSPRRFRFVPMA